MFDSVLIANRGEIAVRIARTARRMGLRVIAVYSEADAGALHVRMADEAYPIGPAPAAQSYLDGEAILEVAQKAGAACLHPGYGFLAENAAFAEQCAAAGVVFIGPPPSAMRAMGQKHTAKALMEKAGVPVLPGYHGEAQDDAVLGAEAARIGFPLLIKPSSGGGGKGMRRVFGLRDFGDELGAARREALSSFGDEHLLLEKYIEKPRHIEIQILADHHGNAVHLFERDCSAQRRHQKVVEEAPAPGMTEAVRAAMCDAAIAAARAVGYTGAGTVEFLAAPDEQGRLSPDAFFFLEMNTRLQVEHPVTEMITGQDLVEWQLRVAAGEILPSRLGSLKMNGHAIEARLYSEDPARGFLPSTGPLRKLVLPEGENVRVDAGVDENSEVSAWYDPMIAKIIAHGKTRAVALEKLRTALEQVVVAGPRTNAAFLRRLIAHADFARGGIDTHFIEAAGDALTRPDATRRRRLVAAAAAEVLRRQIRRDSGDEASPWAASDGWQLGGVRSSMLEVLVDGEPQDLTIVWHPDGFHIGWPGGEAAGQGEADCALFAVDNGIWAVADAEHVHVEPADILSVDLESEIAGGDIRAPMHGKILDVFVAEGDEVGRGSKLATLEAMKMEHVLQAAFDGVVGGCLIRPGDQVEEGDVLVRIARREQ